MIARVMDGKARAERVRQGCRAQIDVLREVGVQHGFAVVMLYDDAASRLYVSNKARAYEEVGIRSRVIAMPSVTTEHEMLETVRELNSDESVHGILVQLPLPLRIDVRKVLETISHQKDVVTLALETSIFPPCIPYGVQLLLESEGIDVSGMNVVIIGASNIVGKPMALMLMHKDATVTVCNAKTRDLAQFTHPGGHPDRRGRCPGPVTAPTVRKGAVVIDVGINRPPDGGICGDVDFEGVKQRASFLTPVPGGVGPMTVTMLLVNTFRSAQIAAGQHLSTPALLA